MTVTDAPTVEERLAAIEAVLYPLRVIESPWTPEQVAEFQKARDAGDWRKHQVKWMPPGPAIALTPEAARALLRECVTVVKPGETLVIRCPDWWTPHQVQEYQQWLDAHPSRESFRVLAVIGEELGIAERKEGATGAAPSPALPD